jgi:hypothetical protein
MSKANTTLTETKPEQFHLLERRDCPVCSLLVEATSVIEELTEAVETGSWTIQTIVRARRYLTAHPELRGPEASAIVGPV